jgi:hypothetical protein
MFPTKQSALSAELLAYTCALYQVGKLLITDWNEYTITIN